mmetsp:Transcript_34682/g.103041  ORF Transcript_34682/g.103041 Transcript_34682/m.103041 type:complete len:292 (+) Transcript_34682:53-928(+)
MLALQQVDRGLTPVGHELRVRAQAEEEEDLVEVQPAAPAVEADHDVVEDRHAVLVPLGVDVRPGADQLHADLPQHVAARGGARPEVHDLVALVVAPARVGLVVQKHVDDVARLRFDHRAEQDVRALVRDQADVLVGLEELGHPASVALGYCLEEGVRLGVVDLVLRLPHRRADHGRRRRQRHEGHGQAGLRRVDQRLPQRSILQVGQAFALDEGRHRAEVGHRLGLDLRRLSQAAHREALRVPTGRVRRSCHVAQPSQPDRSVLRRLPGGRHGGVAAGVRRAVGAGVGAGA